jgi:hypothetical protein
MANFVSLNRAVPDPDLDAISQIAIGGAAGSAGSAQIGLWGYYDSATDTEMTVRITTGPGSVQKGGKRGTRVVAYALYGITESTVVQGFLGERPWTTPLPVVRAAVAGKKRNELLLTSTDPVVQDANVYRCGAPGAFSTRIVPVPINGNPAATSYRGLAIHVTAGEGSAENIVKGTWGSSGIAAHFIIERSGAIVQTVALTLRGEAQGGPGTVGDPNADWLSVELVTEMNNMGTSGYFTSKQIAAANRLFVDLAAKYHFPPVLASPLINDQAEYQAISRSLVARYGLTGANTWADAQKSTGLSCHRWLNKGHACPGLIGLHMMPHFAGLETSGNDLEF